MIIQAGEYELRPFKKDDAINFFNLAHDELVKKYVPYAYPKNIEEANKMVQDYLKGDLKNDFYLLIEQNEILIGMIIAVRYSKKTLDTSAFIAKNFRGKGIMTIAMKSFIKWLYDNTDYENLIMFIEKENIASNCQIKKIGGVHISKYENNNVYSVTIR